MAISTPDTVIESLRLSQLLQSRHADAIDEFWEELKERGTPIFEEFDPEANTWLVTFVFQELEPLENVLLVEWIRDSDFPEKGMTKFEGSDIWYTSLRMRAGLRSQYGFGPNDSMVPKREEEYWETRRSKWITDPLNKTPLIDHDHPDQEQLSQRNSSVFAVPGAPEQTWIEGRDGIETGTTTHHTFVSEMLDNERSVWLYRHPRVRVGTEAPLLISFDGDLHDAILRTPTVLDNLVADGMIEPMVAVFVGNVDRGEELPCNADFVSMLKRELIPFTAQELEVEFFGSRTVVNGVSYGGLAAMFAGLTEPDTFGLVASQSGSFWWKPDPVKTTDIPGESDYFSWLPEQAVTIPQSDIRIWMESGTLEGRGFMGVAPSLLYSNRHMRDVLRARGFDVEYSEYIGGHDYAHWRNSLGDALVHLLGADT